MNLAFERVKCAIAATFHRAEQSWTHAYLAALSTRAARAAESGMLPEAEECCLYVLEKNPAQGQALECLGTIAARRRDWDQAVRYFEQAAAAGVAGARLLRELGRARQKNGDLTKAHDSLRSALELAPRDPDILAYLGELCFTRDDLANAGVFASRALEGDPAHQSALRTYGNVLARRGDLPGAAGILQRAAELAERDPSVWAELGSVRRQLSQLDEARQCFERALVLDPDSAELHISLGDVYLAGQRSDEARSYFQEAVRMAPDMPRAISRLAAVAAHEGNSTEAERLFLQAHDLAPGDLETLIHLGLLYQEAGRVDQALDCYRRAKALDPVSATAHIYSGLSHLYRGEFAAGWEEWEWRLRLPSYQRLREIKTPVWNGENLVNRTILLQREQGVSDNILFLRYAPLLAERGARVVVETFPEMQRLVARMRGIERAVNSADVERVAGEVDLRCPILSLAHRFRTTRESIPASVPYLAADPVVTAAWQKRIEQLPPGRKVGLSWSDGSLAEDGNARGRGPFRELSALRAVAHTVFISLQPAAPTAEQGDAVPALVDWSSHLKDLADTADLIAALDLVIGPSTAVTHLAAAMGKPVWILLPHVTDWRWVSATASSPWYPTARLFRQSAPSEWTQLERDVAETLTALH